MRVPNLRRVRFLEAVSPKLVACAFLCAVALFCSSMQTRAQESADETSHREKRPLTVAAAIETTRVMSDVQGNSIFVSPDGERYAIFLVRGDLDRDGLVATLLVGDLGTLERAASPRKVAEFFTRALAPMGVPNDPGSFQLSKNNTPRWIDNRHVLFLWEDEQAIQQVVSVDVEARTATYLTHHPTHVFAAVVDTAGTLLYSALAQDGGARSDALLRSGFAVQSRDILALLAGNVADASFYDRMKNNEGFIVTAAHPQARRIDMAGSQVNRSVGPVHSVRPAFSPDGRWIVVGRTVDEAAQRWRNYRLCPGWEGKLDQLADDVVPGSARPISQHYLVDVLEAQGRPLWDVPMCSYITKVAWSADSKSLLIGPTALPLPQSDDAALTGHVVAELEVATRKYRRLPVSAAMAARIRDLRWLSRDRAELLLHDGTSHRFVRSREVWRPVSALPSGSPATTPGGRSDPSIQMEFREDMNTPPALYAVDSVTGQERLALDLNPGLQDYTLGQVEMIHWSAPGGQRWTGRLYYPVGYRAGQRYPLVVQTYGYAAPTEFSLYGGGSPWPRLGPTPATKLAQPLANRGVMVLQLDTDGPDDFVGSSEDLAALAAGRESGIESLVARGMVDSGRVGIEGFSALGRHVEYSVAFSDFPYAAAIANDYADNNYLTRILLGDDANSYPGLVPYDIEGLKGFLEKSPAWNAGRVRTPLQIVSASATIDRVLFSWEMFARLRYLRKPVEMFVVPNVGRGNHELQNPQQVRAMQERGLDWWCFWLKDEEDEDARKAGQYSQWRKLRALRDADARTPRPPLYKWQAVPLGMSNSSNKLSQ